MGACWWCVGSRAPFGKDVCIPYLTRRTRSAVRRTRCGSVQAAAVRVESRHGAMPSSQGQLDELQPKLLCLNSSRSEHPLNMVLLAHHHTNCSLSNFNDACCREVHCKMLKLKVLGLVNKKLEQKKKKKK